MRGLKGMRGMGFTQWRNERNEEWKRKLPWRGRRVGA
jgi:hypothetical protein